MERNRIKRLERENEKLNSQQDINPLDSKSDRRLQFRDNDRPVWKKDGTPQMVAPSIAPAVNSSEEWLRRQQEIKEQRREQQLMVSKFKNRF